MLFSMLHCMLPFSNHQTRATLRINWVTMREAPRVRRIAWTRRMTKWTRDGPKIDSLATNKESSKRRIWSFVKGERELLLSLSPCVSLPASVESSGQSIVSWCEHTTAVLFCAKIKLKTDDSSLFFYQSTIIYDLYDIVREILQFGLWFIVTTENGGTRGLQLY